MNIDLKETFEIVENGTSYMVPQYHVVDGEGLVEIDNGGVNIDFVRGSKLAEEEVEKRAGTLHEHLLAVQIHDLKFKNGLVPSRETSIAITKLEEALQWLRSRQIDRAKREVLGTYKK
ncbi:MAG: hypothetical protein AAF840_01760 [Bacteroidota bacterium]